MRLLKLAARIRIRAISIESIAAPQRFRIAPAPSDKAVDDPISEESAFIVVRPMRADNSSLSLQINVRVNKGRHLARVGPTLRVSMHTGFKQTP